MGKATREANKRILELAMALEIAKFQRDTLTAQVALLTTQLSQAHARAERAEERLDRVTQTLGSLAQTAVSRIGRSSATEVWMDGKAVLRLSNPINCPDSAIDDEGTSQPS